MQFRPLSFAPSSPCTMILIFALWFLDTVFGHPGLTSSHSPDLRWCPANCVCSQTADKSQTQTADKLFDVVCAKTDTYSSFPGIEERMRTAITKIDIRNQPRLVSIGSQDLDGFIHLAYLSITSCSLTSISDKNLLNNLTHLEYANFAGNKIETFSWKSARVRAKQPPQLNLSDNPLSCECANYWIFNYDSFTENTFDVESLREILSLPSQALWTNKKPARCAQGQWVVVSEDKVPCGLFESPCLGSPWNSIMLQGKEEHVKEIDIPKVKLDGVWPKVVHAGETVSLFCSSESNDWMTDLRILNADAGTVGFFGDKSVDRSTISRKRSLTRSENRSQGKVRNQTMVLRNVSIFNSGFVLCIEENDFVFSAAIQPLIVKGPPGFHTSTSPNHSQRVSQTTSRLDTLIYGIPFSNVSLYKVNHGTVLLDDKVSVTLHHNSLVHFYAVTLAIEFKEYSTLCVKGRYEIYATNSFGSANSSFEMLEGGCVVGCDESCEHCLNDWSVLRPIIPCKMTNIKPPPLAGIASVKNQTIAEVALNTASPERLFIVLTSLGATVLLFVFIICCLCLFLHWSRIVHRRGTGGVELQGLKHWRELTPLTTMRDNELYTNWTQALQLDEKIAFYDENYFEVMRELGEGAFGRVLLVNVQLPEHAREDSLYVNAPALMALKELKTMTAEKIVDLKNEALIMNTLDHPNVVRFYGVSFRQCSVALLFEFMPQGDLVNYLRDRAPDNTKDLQQISMKDQLFISVQVAQGLKYLSEQHLVHRDLAARNCLVGEHLQVKISDFGMTRDTYVTDYYKMGNHAMVPLRWLPPECLLYRRFTAESDVWSFGVVLWEIFSYGRVPWYMYSNTEVFQCITDGKLLEKPEHASEEIHGLMLQCWNKQPNERITMAEMNERLSALMADCMDYLNLIDVVRESEQEAIKNSDPTDFEKILAADNVQIEGCQNKTEPSNIS